MGRARHATMSPDMTCQRGHWVFGYGSLIWKADFPYIERQVASIRGWSRRFWQGSHDHRGTPDAPGRVLTLVPEADARCPGMAYRIEEDVFDHLDYREKNGYRRFDAEMSFVDGATASGTVYIATEDNAAFLGPAPVETIARHIASCHGPSGTNVEYFLNLDRALKNLGVDEPHLRAIAEALDGLEGG